MTKRLGILATLIAAGLMIAVAAWAADAKTYQVTGPVLEMSDNMIVVQKGKDRWELARDASTKMPEGLKVGDKVTIMYRMTAVDVQAKPAAAKAKSTTKKAAK